MKTWKYNNRGLWLFFALAIVVHAVFILAPRPEKMVAQVTERPSVRVQLVAQPQAVEVERPPEPVPVVERREPEPPALDELPLAPVSELPVPVVVQQLPSNNSKRLLSNQFDYESFVPEPEDRPDFYLRQRTSLEMVLNQPSLQLPFEDSRIYLVDNYDDGIMGGIDRFWDNVSVPFGFTTKNNTRVQCVWVLVIGGCAWGHKTLFYRPARLREKPKEPALEST
jgi:hypothetical protein